MSERILFRARPNLDQSEVTLDGGASWFVVAGLPPEELRETLGDSPHRQAAPADFTFMEPEGRP